MANISPEREALVALLASADIDQERRFDPHALNRLHLVRFDNCPGEQELALKRTVALGNLGHTAAIYAVGGNSITPRDGDVVHHDCDVAVLLSPADDAPGSYEFQLLNPPVHDVTIVRDDHPPVAFSRTVL